MALSLEFTTTLYVTLADPILIGETPYGHRMVVPITGGHFEGPNLSGEVLSTGSDWNIYRPQDESSEIWARYDLRTNDGVFISILNEGVGHLTPDVPMKVVAAEPIGAGTWIMKTRPRFEAPINSKYAWLNRSVFVAEIPYPDKPKLAVIHVYQVV